MSLENRKIETLGPFIRHCVVGPTSSSSVGASEFSRGSLTMLMKGKVRKGAPIAGAPKPSSKLAGKASPRGSGTVALGVAFAGDPHHAHALLRCLGPLRIP